MFILRRFFLRRSLSERNPGVKRRLPVFASRKADTNIGVDSITDTTEALG